MEESRVRAALEAILFTTGKAVKLSDIAKALDLETDAVREAAVSLKEQYETVMADAKHLIGKLATVDDLNQALDVIQGMDHALTSKKESGALLNAKAVELGFKYSRSAGGFIEKE